MKDYFIEGVNSVLSRERAAYRFAGAILIKITEEEGRSAVEGVLSSDVPSTVRQHIAAAAKYYSLPSGGDYRNSIKESVSAVEAAINFILEEKAYGKAAFLKLKERLSLHPSMAQGFEKLYCYTSDASGIRHALSEGDGVASDADARYMLVSCSAFASYILNKYSGHRGL